ncbi:MAG TPA: hypothetical protein VN648_08975, partial [Candidatus Methylomirabilis sp.]|nr:hypothetical protein [Candidatus Methylomirabilis sp.]
PDHQACRDLGGYILSFSQGQAAGAAFVVLCQRSCPAVILIQRAGQDPKWQADLCQECRPPRRS